jgi:hypothetical protein
LVPGIVEASYCYVQTFDTHYEDTKLSFDEIHKKLAEKNAAAKVILAHVSNTLKSNVSGKNNQLEKIADENLVTASITITIQDGKKFLALDLPLERVYESRLSYSLYPVKEYNTFASSSQVAIFNTVKFDDILPTFEELIAFLDLHTEKAQKNLIQGELEKVRSLIDEYRGSSKTSDQAFQIISGEERTPFSVQGGEEQLRQALTVHSDVHETARKVSNFQKSLAKSLEEIIKSRQPFLHQSDKNAPLDRNLQATIDELTRLNTFFEESLSKFEKDKEALKQQIISFYRNFCHSERRLLYSLLVEENSIFEDIREVLEEYTNSQNSVSCKGIILNIHSTRNMCAICRYSLSSLISQLKNRFRKKLSLENDFFFKIFVSFNEHYINRDLGVDFAQIDPDVSKYGKEFQSPCELAFSQGAGSNDTRRNHDIFLKQIRQK